MCILIFDFCLGRMKDTKGEARMWDINGDIHDPLDGTTGLLKLSKLSLHVSFFSQFFF